MPRKKVLAIKVSHAPNLNGAAPSLSASWTASLSALMTGLSCAATTSHPAGIYFLRLEAAGQAITRRVVVLGR